MSLVAFQRAQERRRRRTPRARWLWAFVLALLGNVTLLGLMVFLSVIHVGDSSRESKRAVTLRPLSNSEWNLNRTPSTERASQPAPKKQVAQAEPPASKPPEKKPEPIPKGQVVDVQPGNNQEDENAKYLAESSNKVQRETKSKDQTPNYRNAMPQRTTSTPQKAAGGHDSQLQISGNQGIGSDDRPLNNAGKKAPTFEVPDMAPRQQVAMKLDPTGIGPGAPVANQSESARVHGNSNRLSIQPGEAGGSEGEASQGKRGQPGIMDLMPSMAVVDKITGAAANDHLEDVDDGQGTYLNTREWKYASFFNRVKQSVGMHWDPQNELRQRDPTGNVYGSRDRYTVINVTLTERGTIKDIYVEKSCGLDFLDAEAIRAFQNAQPFPNPPPGLLASDATIHFPFGFFLEMSSGASLHLFRSGG